MLQLNKVSSISNYPNLNSNPRYASCASRKPGQYCPHLARVSPNHRSKMYTGLYTLQQARMSNAENTESGLTRPYLFTRHLKWLGEITYSAMQSAPGGQIKKYGFANP